MKDPYQIPNVRIVECIGIQFDMKNKKTKCSDGILMLQLIDFDKCTILKKSEAYIPKFFLWTILYEVLAGL